MIDPFGFFLESFDALGRWRELENGHKIDTKISNRLSRRGSVDNGWACRRSQSLHKFIDVQAVPSCGKCSAITWGGARMTPMIRS